MDALLNSASPLPLYRQLADLLTSRIRRGDYAPGSRLPSEPSLAEQFAIGRPTVRQATELLVRHGLAERRRGAGTFVLEPSRAVDLFSLSGTMASFQEQGIQLQTQLIEPLARKRIRAQAHNPFGGREAYVFKRLSRVKRQPVLLEEIYLDPSVFPELERFNLAGASLSRLIERDYHRVPRSASQRFSVVRPDRQRAALLGRAPLLLVRRYIQFDGVPGRGEGLRLQDSPIYSELYCRTASTADEIVFSQTIFAQAGSVSARSALASSTEPPQGAVS
jgi:GntR family transcriptional regulator